MKKSLERQSGVQSAQVSLLTGMVEVTPKEGARLDPGQLLKVTYDSGVTVAEMNMTASGKILRDSSGNLSLQIAPDQSFAIVPGDLSRKLEPVAGGPRAVTVRAEVYKKPSGKKKAKYAGEPLQLTILEIQRKD